jgi:hypothetical protein
MTSAVGNDKSSGRGNRAINIRSFKTCKARTEFGKEGKKGEEKSIAVPTVLLCLLLGLFQLVLQFGILLGLVIDYRRRSSATDKGAKRNKKLEPFEMDLGSTS